MDGRVDGFRPEFNIRLIYVLVNLALVGLLIGAVVTVVNLRDNHLSVEAQYPRSNVRLPSGVELRHDPTVTLDVADPTTKQKLLSFGTVAVLGFLVALGLWLLRGVAASVRAGDPFSRENVRRLRGLGYLLVGGAPLGALVDQALRYELVNTLPQGRYGDAMAPGWDLPAGVMLAGVGAFILAEVVDYGFRLREDVDATV
jgi:Protein of unknown function (DUF2975)